MLIDWMTLRYPLDASLGAVLHERLMASLNTIVQFTADGEKVWEKQVLDWDSIRSDSQGLFWSMQGDGKQYFLVIGASPSSLINFGVNVFGCLDVIFCAQTLVDYASLALESILPHARLWQCRRMDITCNYDLGGPAQVKQALRTLLGTDSPRRKASSSKNGGDTVTWNQGSDRMSGKAYHKGPQMAMLERKGKINPDVYGFVQLCHRKYKFDELVKLCDRVLRLELKLGSRWFREREGEGYSWTTLLPMGLMAIHNKYFAEILGSDNKPMELHMENIYDRLLEVVDNKGEKLSVGRAKSAYGTWLSIKQNGYDFAKDSLNPGTFRKHMMLLRRAGLSNADLTSATIIPLVRKTIVLADPVISFEEIMSRRAAA